MCQSKKKTLVNGIMSVNRLAFIAAPEVFPKPNQHMMDDQDRPEDENHNGIKLKSFKVIRAPMNFVRRKAK